ncbi:hypothetical protein GH714_027001 [Hevea brasiliensis]|uniref:ABC transporter domain-containing protein n=1 Tax=Hevea brasiliensis TaxID=3981 RepID=A0A6A6MDT5_HEVBR|nr:hypothetical protein GH714_027001 [Hevea brasiliensis]
MTLLVDECGGLLSGGQRQVASALDAVSECLVQDAQPFDEEIYIGYCSHRLSTVQNAHEIILCSGGRITELGI